VDVEAQGVRFVALLFLLFELLFCFLEFEFVDVVGCLGVASEVGEEVNVHNFGSLLLLLQGVLVALGVGAAVGPEDDFAGA
jgi:hypothetical protein